MKKALTGEILTQFSPLKLNNENFSPNFFFMSLYLRENAAENCQFPSEENFISFYMHNDIKFILIYVTVFTLQPGGFWFRLKYTLGLFVSYVMQKMNLSFYKLYFSV